MSYYNFSFAAKKGIKPKDIILLQLLSQNRAEDLSEIIESEINTDILREYEDKGYTEYIKSKKKSDTVYNTVRLSKKGKELLELITTPDLTEGDQQLYEYMVNMYLNGEDEERSIGNRKAGLMYCSQYRQITGLTLHQMFYLMELFCAEQKFTKVLEYIFFSKKENPYSKFKDNIESSKIHQFYLDNKERVHTYWAQKIKE